VFDQAPRLAGQQIDLVGSPWSLMTVICICLFVGAMGKSAQVPLHVWLPDSMEGPTPISALIHAATMVTAGIFMVARMSPLFELSDTALSVVLVIGAITALSMGFLGIIQNDIKRVVAYSTLSQLGYMTVALGASAYSAAIFHLMTHAFFKALLFLAAGSVIIGMHHDQDIRHMGGLRQYMPITWITSLVGSLALIGTPFFSGFYSKDSIIETVALSNTPGASFAYICVLLGVFVTAFYSFRMYFLVFHGQERFAQTCHEQGSDHHHVLQPGQKPHESPLVVTIPLIALAVPSLLIGYLLVEPMVFGKFFQSAIYMDIDKHPALHMLTQNFHGAAAMGLHALKTWPLWLALAGVAAAWWIYLRQPSLATTLREHLAPLYTLLDNKYYFDRFNETVLAAGARRLGRGLWQGADQGLIDGILVNGSARLVQGIAALSRSLQSGFVYHYAFSMIIGVFVLLTAWVTLT